jgi:hypothetical protein
MQALYGLLDAGAHCAESEIVLIGTQYAELLVPLVVYTLCAENGHQVDVICVRFPVFAEKSEVVEWR